jgi:hypothetical protein
MPLFCKTYIFKIANMLITAKVIKRLKKLRISDRIFSLFGYLSKIRVFVFSGIKQNNIVYNFVIWIFFA